MNRSRTIATLLAFGLVAGAVACAKGTTTDELTPAGFVPAQATDRAEPSEHETLPAPQSTDDSAKDPSPSEKDGGATDAATAETGPSGASSCATTPPSNACGLVPQCGCASNETCEVTDKATGTVGCTLAGGGPVGSMCTSQNQCATGLTCAYGACRAFCPTKGAACAGGGTCTSYVDAAGHPIPNANVCTIPCDLRNASAACGSNTCIWDTSVKAADCDKAGTKGVFQECFKYNDCAPNLACVPGFVRAECEKWCGSSSECGFFQSCVDVYGADAPVEGGLRLGHCQGF